jgi:toxin YoeB
MLARGPCSDQRSYRLKRGDRRAFVHPDFREDLRYWIATERRIALRIMELMEAVLRDPLEGIGKPELLKGDKQGIQSRREHRLLYRVTEDSIAFLQARHHYTN